MVFIVFGQTLGFGFLQFDDNQNVYEEPHITGGLSLQGVEWAFTHTQVGRWAPAAAISRQVDCQLFGLWAGGHHLTNLILHALASALLFLVLRKLTGFTWRSAFVAAVFALHPLHAEAVAWVSTRGELLSGVFFMLALWSYASYVRKPSLPHYAMCMTWFLLGLMGKPMIVTLPFILLALDYWPLGRAGTVPWPRLVMEKAPFFMLSIIFCAATFVVSANDVITVTLPASLRIQNAMVSYGAYIRQTVWPAGLSAYYPNPMHAFPAWETGVALVLLCVVSLAAFRLRKGKPALLVGWLWYVVILAPVIGIVQVSDYARADRYAYLPQTGLIIAATWFISDAAGKSRRGRTVLAGMAAFILPVLSICTFRQASFWGGDYALWSHAVECTTDNYFARNMLGYTVYGHGKVDEAMSQYREALRINPAYLLARDNLGNALLRVGRVDEAIAQFREALRIDPGNGEAHDNLGNALMRMGRTDDAMAQYRVSLLIDPGVASRHYNFSNLLFGQGHAAEALAHAEKAAALQPGVAVFQGNLAFMLATAPPPLRNGARALQIAQRACASGPGANNAVCFRALAAAYAESGDFPNAVQAAQKAMQIAMTQNNPQFADTIAGEAKIYASGHSYPAGK